MQFLQTPVLLHGSAQRRAYIQDIKVITVDTWLTNYQVNLNACVQVTFSLIGI